MTDLDSPSKRLDDHDEVELRLAADLTHLPVVRSVGANIATRADFDLDAIADLRLAIDEACSVLVARAMPGSKIVCVFALVAGEFRFTGQVNSVVDSTPSTGTFGWRVLLTLADAAFTWTTDGEQDDGQYLNVSLSKKRTVVPG